MQLIQIAVFLSVVSSTAGTASPTSTGPTTCGPTTCGPTTCGPTTCGPTTCGPTTCGPTTLGPTTCGPTTCAPTFPTFAPTTSSPTSCAPTSSPTTGSPTQSPSISLYLETTTSSVVLIEGGSQKVGVRLSKQPTLPSIKVTVNKPYDLACSHTSLTFDANNWATYQNLTFTATNDSIVEGQHTRIVNLNVTADSIGYTDEVHPILIHISELAVYYKSFTPYTGWTTGGTTVTVTMNQSLVGLGVTTVPPLGCYFGTAFVNGTLNGASGVDCVAPTCDLATGSPCTASTSVALMVTISNTPSVSNLLFKYIVEPSVVAASPVLGEGCCDTKSVTVQLSNISYMPDFDEHAYCKFGYLTSKATHSAGTVFTCNAPVRYDLKDSTEDTEVAVQMTLNGQQYTSVGSSYTYVNAQAKFDALAWQFFATVVAALVGLYFLRMGICYLCCGKKAKKGKVKDKEPKGATALLEHISKDLLKDSFKNMQGGEELINTIELFENAPWEDIEEIRLWKRILCIRCGLKMRELEFEMAKPFGELDIRLSKTWLSLFRHEFNHQLSEDDLNEKFRLGPFGHWPICPSKALDGLVSQRMARRKKTVARVKAAGDSTVAMGIQIQFSDVRHMMKSLSVHGGVMIRAKCDGKLLSECKIEKQHSNGTLQMQQMNIMRSQIADLRRPVVFEVLPVKARTIHASALDLGAAEIGDRDTKHSNSPSMSESFDESEIAGKGGDEKEGLTTSKIKKSIRKRKPLGRCTLSFYDLYDLSASQRRLFGVYGELEKLCVGTLTFLQTVTDVAGAAPKSVKKKLIRGQKKEDVEIGSVVTKRR